MNVQAVDTYIRTHTPRRGLRGYLDEVIEGARPGSFLSEAVEDLRDLLDTPGLAPGIFSPAEPEAPDNLSATSQEAPTFPHPRVAG